MQTTFKLQSEELDQSFLNAIKSLFKGKSISITVKADLDETEYLLSNPVMKKRLVLAIEKFKKGQFKDVDLKDLK